MAYIPIEQLNDAGEVIATYPTRVAASKATSITLYRIDQYLDGNDPNWRYKDTVAHRPGPKTDAEINAIIKRIFGRPPK
jgi:hypothetical protein